jgi:hypothetical protein
MTAACRWASGARGFSKRPNSNFSRRIRRTAASVLFRRGADDFFSEHGHTDTSPASCIQAVFHSDIVIRDHSFHFDAFSAGEVGCHFEVQDVAGIVLNDVQNACSAADRFGRFEHLIWCG